MSDVSKQLNDTGIERFRGIGNKMSRPPLMQLIVMILFALFTWGFVYNMLKQNGFTELTAQIAGITLGLLAVILLEGITRLRINRLKEQSQTEV